MTEVTRQREHVLEELSNVQNLKLVSLNPKRLGNGLTSRQICCRPEFATLVKVFWLQEYFQPRFRIGSVNLLSIANGISSAYRSTSRFGPMPPSPVGNFCSRAS